MCENRNEIWLIHVGTYHKDCHSPLSQLQMLSEVIFLASMLTPVILTLNMVITFFCLFGVSLYIVTVPVAGRSSFESFARGLWEESWGGDGCCIRPECTRPGRIKRTGGMRWDMTRATSCSLRPLSSAQPYASTCDTPCMSDMRVRVPCDRVGKWCVRAHTRERNE